MPLLTDDTTQQVKTSSGYHFSATSVDELGATEYSLVTIALDKSGSTRHPVSQRDRSQRSRIN